MVPRQGGRLSRLADPESLPGWISDADIDFYVNEFTGLGFRGGLNWYRNTDRSGELLAPFAASRITVPATWWWATVEWIRSSLVSPRSCRNFVAP